MKIDNDIITLVNIYAPNNENCRVDFFKRMQTFINQHSLNIKKMYYCVVISIVYQIKLVIKVLLS